MAYKQTNRPYDRNMQHFYKNNMFVITKTLSGGILHCTDGSMIWAPQCISIPANQTQHKWLIIVWATDKESVWCLWWRHHSPLLINVSLITIMHLHLQLAADVLVTSSTTVQQQAHSPADKRTACQSLRFIRTYRDSGLPWNFVWWGGGSTNSVGFWRQL